jgi:hypothetical protein
MRALSLLLMTAVATMAEPDWRFAHPQAEVLVGVSTNALLESAWADVVRQHFAAHGLPDPVKIAEALDEVHGVYLSSMKQDGLMLLTGTFDNGKTVEFLREQGFEPRFLNRTMILLGDEADLDIAAARMKDDQLRLAVRKGEFANPLFARGREMAREFDCWMVGLMTSVPAETLPGPLKEVRSFSYGLNLDAESELKATLNMRSREGAERLAGLLDRFKSESKEAAEALTVTASGASVTANFKVGQEAFADTLPLLKAAWGRVTNPRPLLAAAPLPAKPDGPVAPPPPPPRKTVLIFGGDSGTKEHGLSPR